MRCEKCSIGSYNKEQILPIGSDSPMIYFINESPGVLRNSVEKYFKGILDKLGINENNSRYSNLTQCIPQASSEDNSPLRQPTEEEIENCSDKLKDDILKTNPKVIITLGNTVSKALIGDDYTVISKCHGNIYTVMIGDIEYLAIPAYHPSYLMRNDSNKTIQADFVEDIEKAVRTCIDPNRELGISKQSNKSPDTVMSLDYESFDNFCKEYIDNKSIIGYDLETNAEDTRSMLHEVVGFSLASSRDIGVYVPLNSLEYKFTDEERKKVEDRLRDILATRETIVVYNSQHEIPATLNWLGIEIINIEDIYIMVKLMMGNADSYLHNSGLKAQAIMHLKYSDWSKDLDSYFKYIQRYQKVHKDDMRNLIDKYYSGDQADHIISLIEEEVDRGLKKAESGNIISYEYVPSQIIGKYGSIDSSVLFDLRDYYYEWMTKESKILGVDLYKGYGYWVKHHIAGYILERNGAYWNDTIAKQRENWCLKNMKESIEGLVKSPLSRPYIKSKVYPQFLVYLKDNYIGEILGPHVVPKRLNKASVTVEIISNTEDQLRRFARMSLTPNDKGLIKLELGNIDTLSDEMLPNKQEICDRWSEEFVDIFTTEEHTIDEYKKILNPNASNQEFREFVSNALITTEVKYAKLYTGLIQLVEDPSFDINMYRSEHDIKLLTLINKLRVSDMAESQKLDMFCKYISSGLQELSTRIQYTISKALSYTLNSLDADSTNELYELYLICHIDVEDRSTWNEQFEWLFNYKLFKKFAKMLSTYIYGKVGHKNVWRVDKESIIRGDSLVKRETLYNDKTVSDEGKVYLLQPSYGVNTASTGRWQCLDENTKIPLVNGKTIPIKDLENERDFYVYSYDYNKGHIVPALCSGCKQTGSNTPMLEIELDNGEKFRCTPEHKLMKRNGHFIEAQDAEIGMSMMPLYKRLTKDGYEEIYLTNSDNWIRTHHLSQELVYGPGWRYNDFVSHHRDFNKLNDDPRNLIRMKNKQHWRYHSSKGWKMAWMVPENRKLFTDRARVDMINRNKDPEYRRKVMNDLKEFFEDKERSRELRELHRNNLINRNKDPEYRRRRTSEGIRKWLENKDNREFKAKIARENIKICHIKREQNPEYVKSRKNSLQNAYQKKAIKRCMEYYEKHNNINEDIYNNKIKKPRQSLWESMVTYAGSENNLIDIIKSGDRSNQLINHKIVSIKRVENSKRVYDLHVEKYHNFAIDSGIIVHNSGIHNLPQGDSIKNIYTSRYPGGTIMMPDGCLVGDTKIRLASGTMERIENLVGLKEFYVYSYDEKTGKTEIGRAHSCKEVKVVDELLEIKFNTGQVVTCTLDHKFFCNTEMRMKEACEYKVGDSILSVKFSKKFDNFGYERETVTHANTDKEVFTYYLADNYNVRNNIIDNIKYGGTYVNRHHIDFNIDNNSPNNIERLSPKDHCRIHSKANWNNKNIRERMIESTKSQWRSPEYREMMRETSKKFGAKALLRSNSNEEAINIRTTSRRKLYLERFETGLKKLLESGYTVKDLIIDEYNYDDNLKKIGLRGQGYGIRSIVTKYDSLFNYLMDNVEVWSDYVEDVDIVIEDISFINSIGNSSIVKQLCNIFRICDSIAHDYGESLEEGNFSSYQEKAKFLGSIYQVRSLDTVDKYFGSFDNYKKYSKLNHYIVSINYINQESTPVYCFQVDEYHNFFIDDYLSSNSQMEIRALAAESGDENLLQAFRDKVDIHRLFACFTGDTEILSPDGSKHTFKDLVDSGIKELEVYARDRNGKVVRATAINPTMTKIVDRLLEVELEDGTIIRCTPEHRFMLSDGTYKEAQYLTPEDDIADIECGV